MDKLALAQDPNTSPDMLWALCGGSPSLLENPDAVRGCSLSLSSLGLNRSAVIRALQDFLVLNLREIQEVIARLPIILMGDVSFVNALEQWRYFRSLGAHVTLSAPGLTFDNELCPSLAQNPGAPSSLYWYLALHPSDTTQEALVQNPGIPLELLCILAPSFSDAFLQNPILPLLQLEDPSLKQFSEDSLVAMAMNTDVVLALLPAMMRSDACKLVAFGDLSRFPEEVVSTLALDPSAQVRAVVARFLISGESLFASLAQDEEVSVRLILAENINIPLRVLLVLLYDEDAGVREVARDNRSRGSVINAILQSPDSSSAALDEVARRLYTLDDPEVNFVCLFEPENWSVRGQLLAQHPNTPMNRLEELWQRGGEGAWLGLARNPNTPSFMLEVMAYSQDDRLLDVLVDNPSAPLDLVISQIEKRRI